MVERSCRESMPLRRREVSQDRSGRDGTDEAALLTISIQTRQTSKHLLLASALHPPTPPHPPGPVYLALFESSSKATCRLSFTMSSSQCLRRLARSSPRPNTLRQPLATTSRAAQSYTATRYLSSSSSSSAPSRSLRPLQQSQYADIKYLLYSVQTAQTLTPGPRKLFSPLQLRQFSLSTQRWGTGTYCSCV